MREYNLLSAQQSVKLFLNLQNDTDVRPADGAGLGFGFGFGAGARWWEFAPKGLAGTSVDKQVNDDLCRSFRRRLRSISGFAAMCAEVFFTDFGR